MEKEKKTTVGTFTQDPTKSIVKVQITRRIPDGVYVWVELDRLGHAFWSLFKDEKIIVYTYGRYDDVDTIPITGEGILIKYTGNHALSYIKKILYLKNGYSNVYRINDADLELAIKYSDNLWLSSNERPDRMSTSNNIKTHGRVINNYNLFIRNCVTTTIDLIEKSGTTIFWDLELDPKTPHGLFIQLDMKSQMSKKVKKYTNEFKLVFKDN
ncbi:hypothetical protein [Avibacterium sp. 21-599]|uniref:hypothetical protein n=1 Tax=Avibacterium sp. 21-599 TaxID=2911528 RepID=UPI002247DB52|nr:hypothetical protein [Avibacterium sp. 21-599]MCW9718664.1 hypothetical protein [Avibacterium sp. 21-599]